MYPDVAGWNSMTALQPGGDLSTLTSPYQITRDELGNTVQGNMGVPAYFEKEPATEFQRYVASSIGTMLPIFGASLFERVPATFAPVDRVPVSADYLIAPGDELQVTVWGNYNFSRRFIVSRTGEIILPDAGPISVAGMKYSQAATAFKSALSRFYTNFDVNVSMGRLHSIQIFVVGEVRRPGSYTVSSLSTLVNGI